MHLLTHGVSGAEIASVANGVNQVQAANQCAEDGTGLWVQRQNT